MFKGGKRQVRGGGREKRGGHNSLNGTLQCCVFILAIISIAHFWDRLRA